MLTILVRVLFMLYSKLSDGAFFFVNFCPKQNYFDLRSTQTAKRVD